MGAAEQRFGQVRERVAGQGIGEVDQPGEDELVRRVPRRQHVAWLEVVVAEHWAGGVAEEGVALYLLCLEALCQGVATALAAKTAEHAFEGDDHVVGVGGARLEDPPAEDVAVGGHGNGVQAPREGAHAAVCGRDVRFGCEAAHGLAGQPGDQGVTEGEDGSAVVQQ